jgi:REP element-mobilizing transposase RayT
VFPKEPNPKLKRVEYELRSSGVKLPVPNPLRTGTHTRGYLPHVKREGASYFVTFRLADSLPKEVLLRLQRERAQRLRQLVSAHQKNDFAAEPGKRAELEEEVERDYYRKVERTLDQGIGECHLRRPEIGGLVAAALQHFDGERYLLRAWVVMPNHVHALLWPMPNHDLSAISKTWKGFTAREANKILNRTGNTFWQPEPFDHWIRNDEEHARICHYITNNPVKARLCSQPENWRWSSAWRS